MLGWTQHVPGGATRGIRSLRDRPRKSEELSRTADVPTRACRAEVFGEVLPEPVGLRYRATRRRRFRRRHICRRLLPPERSFASFVLPAPGGEGWRSDPRRGCRATAARMLRDLLLQGSIPARFYQLVDSDSRMPATM